MALLGVLYWPPPGSYTTVPNDVFYIKKEIERKLTTCACKVTYIIVHVHVQYMSFEHKQYVHVHATKKDLLIAMYNVQYKNSPRGPRHRPVIKGLPRL